MRLLAVVSKLTGVSTNVEASEATVATAKVTVMATVMVTVTAAHRQRQPLTGLTYPLSPA